MASPTPEELQAQINALQQQMNQIIGMADDDFVLPWSGEEFEELLSGAGAASVRYDTAQELSATQQAQARSNIGAASATDLSSKAPGGYGWGDSANLSFATLADFQTWFMANGAAKAARNAYAASVYIKRPINDRMLMIASGDYAATGITILLYGYLGINYQIRVDYKGVWTPIEYANPRLDAGVEYRTTERYQGKPVYAQFINLGAAPSPGTTKGTDIANAIYLSLDGTLDYSSYRQVLPLFTASGTVGLQVKNSSDTIQVQAMSGTTDYSSKNVHVLAKYVKSTD